MPMVSSHMPQNTSDCCCRSLWMRGRRRQARASIPKSANGKSHETCPPSDILKRRNGPAAPVSKIPPNPPPVGCCCRVTFPPVLVDPPFPFVEGIPFPPVLPERLAAFVGAFAGRPPPNPPPNRPRRRSRPL